METTEVASRQQHCARGISACVGRSNTSVGVMIASAMIWYNPKWQILDLICRVLFSVLVLGTTIQMLCNILEVLIERAHQKRLMILLLRVVLWGFPGVVVVHELHFWAITIGRSLLACHILVAPHVDTDEILQAVTDYCEYVHEISCVNIWVEQDHWSSRWGL